MPVTRVQKFIFLLMMAFTMTIAMETYNLVLNSGGFSSEILLPLLFDLPPMWVIVMIVQASVGGPLAHRLAFRFVRHGVDTPFKIGLYISTCTVFIMCPLMSVAATLIFKSAEGAFLTVWFKTFLINLPFAFAWQMLFAGPFVRFLFRTIVLKETFRTLSG